jgi:tetratricopeptide (TPR) repeat protein
MIQVGTVLGRMNRAAEANEILAAAVARLDDAPRGEQWVRAQLVRTLLSSSEYKTADAAGLVAEVKPYVSQFPHLQADLDYAEGQLAFQTGKFRMGAQKLQAAIAHFSKVHGEDSSRVAEAKWRIGILHLYRNDWQEAERELTQALRMLKARSAPGHRDLLVVQRDLAFAKMRSGHREEAYALIDEIVGNARKRAELDSNKAFLAGALQTWGRIRLSAGDMAAAERAFNEAVALVSNGNERNVFPAMIRFDVSQVLHARGDKAAASSMAKEVIEIYTEPKAGYSPTNVAVAYISLAAVVKDTDPALAKEWLAKGRAHDWSETAFPSTLSRAYLIAAEIAAAEQNREGVLKELTAARALLSKHASNPEAAFRHAQVDLLTIRLLGAGAPQSEAPCAGIETVREVVARFTVESSTAHRHANEAKQLCTAEHGRRT